MNRPNHKPRFILQLLPLAAIVALAAYGIDLAAAASAAAQAKPAHLQEVLSQMDASAAKFRSAEAEIKKEHFEKIVSDTSTDSGAIYFLRAGNSVQFGAKFNPPDAKTVEYKNGKVRLYTAGTNQIQEFSASGANQARFETFGTLGFGGTGSDLARQWTIADLGAELVSDGGKSIPVEKLDLVSKDASSRSTYSHVTIWVDPTRDVTLKQEFFTPSGDTDTAIYTNIRLNQTIDLKPYAIKCQGKCS